MRLLCLEQAQDISSVHPNSIIVPLLKGICTAHSEIWRCSWALHEESGTDRGSPSRSGFLVAFFVCNTYLRLYKSWPQLSRRHPGCSSRVRVWLFYRCSDDIRTMILLKSICLHACLRESDLLVDISYSVTRSSSNNWKSLTFRRRTSCWYSAGSTGSVSKSTVG